MKTFYTITSSHTRHTNDQSKRFDSFDDALREATNRLGAKPEVEGVVILQSVKLIKRDRPPIVQEEMEPEATLPEPPPFPGVPVQYPGESIDL